MRDEPIDFEAMWQEKRAATTYYLCFYDMPKPKHCFVMMVFPGGGLRIESRWSKLDIEPFTELQTTVALEMFIEAGFKVEEVKPGELPEGRHIPGLGTCVSISKRILGINEPWIFTPAQLARWCDGQRRESPEKG